METGAAYAFVASSVVQENRPACSASSRSSSALGAKPSASPLSVPPKSREHVAALVAAERLKGLYGELVASAKADDDRVALESAAATELGTSF